MSVVQAFHHNGGCRAVDETMHGIGVIIILHTTCKGKKLFLIHVLTAYNGGEHHTWHMWAAVRRGHWLLHLVICLHTEQYNVESHVISAEVETVMRGLLGSQPDALIYRNESGLNLTSTLRNSASSCSALHDSSAPLCRGNLAVWLKTKNK